MAYNLRWRKAVIVSVICHVFLFIGAGYLSAHMLTIPIIEEKYVELELMNERQVENVNDNTPSTVSTAQQSQSTPLPARNQQVTSSSSTVTTTDTTSVVTTEGLTITSISGSKTANVSTESTVTGNASANNTVTKSSGNNLIPPSILSKIDPTYPQSARLVGIEGTVILSIQIYENGRLGSLTISRSSGNVELDNAAISAVKQWRFVPAKDRNSNQPTACYTTIPISFHLK